MREAEFHKKNKGHVVVFFWWWWGRKVRKVRKEAKGRETTEAKKGEKRRGKKVRFCTHQCRHNQVLSA